MDIHEASSRGVNGCVHIDITASTHGQEQETSAVEAKARNDGYGIGEFASVREEVVKHQNVFESCRLIPVRDHGFLDIYCLQETKEKK